MFLSDFSVKRPVFATVISLVLVVFGLVAFDRLPLREYPDTNRPLVSVSTTYRGASASVVENRITQVIEDRISGVEGIKTVTSSSSDGISRINIEFDLNRDLEAATNDIRDRVSGVLRVLPEEASPPQVSKSQSDGRPIMWFNLSSDSMNALELTDYAERFLVDPLSVVDGVANVNVSGAKRYAMRIWIERRELAARGLTVGDVENALRAENVEFPAGTVKSEARDFSVRMERGYTTEEDFRNLVLQRGSDGYLVRLGDVARVELSAEEDRTSFRGNGVTMVGVGIVQQSTANTLTMARAVKAEAEKLSANLPPGMSLILSNDSTVFVEHAVQEVYQTLFIAAVLVVLVIYLFLGDYRAMLVPAVTLPVSLIATFIVLLALGFSANLLTLLALVLAIGLVVDDGIVVLENIHRRMRLGESPRVAAFRGAGQVGFAVLATTLVLIAVFVPITFLQGEIGRLFSEFSVTMAAAIFFSMLVALTLSPVICTLVLKPETEEQIRAAENNWFARIQNGYRNSLAQVLKQPVSVNFAYVLILALIGFLITKVPSEFAPREDRGMFMMMIQGPQGASFEDTMQSAMAVEERMQPLVDSGEIKRLLVRAPGSFGPSGSSFNDARAVVVLEDWDKRRSVWEITNEVRRRTADIPGARIFAMTPQAFGGMGGNPVQFVLQGGTYEELVEWRDLMLAEVANNPGLVGMDHDYQETKPQLRVTINRDRAADLGVSVTNIGRTLESMLGSRLVTTFMINGEERDVIVEGIRQDHESKLDMTNIYVRSAGNALIPLSNLVAIEEFADADTLNRYNRLRSITLSGSLADGYSLGEALDYLETTAREILPGYASFDYKGESLLYKESGDSVYFVFVLALLVVFLVLAAQFESFIQPVVIMLTVPMAVAGALLGLYFAGQSLNIYSQIGIIMLVGLAAKNGILIVEFINQLRDEGMEFDLAIIEACSQRLRPILMTAVTTVAGAVPLVIASGAGTETRFVIGLVVITGVSVATLFTIYVVPVAFQMWARRTGSPKLARQRLERDLGTEA
ncbi:efflux RND transporter permease subunit [Gilvimarinus sp. F26214L]|uniref:efflux RND transporter permease subunit n=1 Tax=Gilvimarinus sp. DZF01 TaxID=3461371 RepID=UPI0040454156